MRGPGARFAPALISPLRSTAPCLKVPTPVLAAPNRPQADLAGRVPPVAVHVSQPAVATTTGSRTSAGTAHRRPAEPLFGPGGTTKRLASSAAPIRLRGAAQAVGVARRVATPSGSRMPAGTTVNASPTAAVTTPSGSPTNAATTTRSLTRAVMIGHLAAMVIASPTRAEMCRPRRRSRRRRGVGVASRAAALAK